MAVELPYGSIPNVAPISPDVNDPFTMQCSLKARLCRTLPSPQPAMISKFQSFVASWLKDHIDPVVPLGFEEWLATTSYNTHRKDQLRASRSEFQTRPTLAKCQEVKMFGKRESYPCFKHARSINSRCDVFKAFSGPIFKAIENELYKLPYFVKHMTMSQRADRVAHIASLPGHFFATDFTAYESHFTPEFMRVCECQLYAHCLVDHPEDASFINKVLTGKNCLRTRFGLRAVVHGRRMSGDMCTSLGNSFTNLMLALFVAKENGSELDGIVEGDDGLFRTNVLLDADMWLRLGFTIKIQEVVDPFTASFCGVVVAPDRSFLRDPRSFLSKFGWSENYIHSSTRVHLQLLRAKAMSALSETPNCPIVSALAWRAYEKTAGVDPRFVSDGYHENVACATFSPPCVSECAREQFSKLYGISSEVQKKLELDIARDEVRSLCGLFHEPSQLAEQFHMFDYVSRFVEET